jgi:hypothetical protein
METGIMVLAMDGRILHVNEDARHFAGLVAEGSHQLSSHSGVRQLPSPLVELFHSVLAQLEKHIAAEDWNRVEITRPAQSPYGTILLRGFGIPDQARRQQSRIVLTLRCQAASTPF